MADFPIDVKKPGSGSEVAAAADRERRRKEKAASADDASGSRDVELNQYLKSCAGLSRRTVSLAVCAAPWLAIAF